ncbi:MAG TPA: trehalose-phosphatase, partial [Planctomycetota bacterium]|nr:trehalose-phosphatase [Planctomycetota bacterium]
MNVQLGPPFVPQSGGPRFPTSEPPPDRLEYWHSLACHTPLGILADLDGTLIPFASTPEEARVGPEVLSVLRDLAALPGVKVAVVSGRPRDSLATLLAEVPEVHLVAEHGGWTRATGAWQAVSEGDPRAIEEMAGELERIAARYP